MKEYKFQGTSNHFIFVRFGSPWTIPTNEQIENLRTLSMKYRMSAEDLCLIPMVDAIDFPQMPDEDYVFFIKTAVYNHLSDSDVIYWDQTFSSMEEAKHDDYIVVFGPYYVNLERCKKTLVPFR